MYKKFSKHFVFTSGADNDGYAMKLKIINHVKIKIVIFRSY